VKTYIVYNICTHKLKARINSSSMIYIRSGCMLVTRINMNHCLFLMRLYFCYFYIIVMNALALRWAVYIITTTPPGLSYNDYVFVIVQVIMPKTLQYLRNVKTILEYLKGAFSGIRTLFVK